MTHSVSAQSLEPFPVRAATPAANTPSTGGALDLERLGEGRVRIQTADAGEHAAEALLSWLRKRREVEELAYDRRSGAIEVRYAEPKRTAGSFAREPARPALRDRAPTGAARVPGGRRAPDRRARAAPPRGGDGRRAASARGRGSPTGPGCSARARRPRAASILVLYDPAVTTAAALLAARRERSATSGRRPPPRRPPEAAGRRRAQHAPSSPRRSTGVAPAPHRGRRRRGHGRPSGAPRLRRSASAGSASTCSTSRPSGSRSARASRRRRRSSRGCSAWATSSSSRPTTARATPSRS